MVGLAARTSPARDAEPDARDARDHESGDHQEERRAEPAREQVEDGLVVEKGIAEIAAQHLSGVAGELDPARLIEAEALAHLFHVLGGRRVVADQHLHRVTRRELNNDEAQHKHAKQQRAETQQTPGDIWDHRRP